MKEFARWFARIGRAQSLLYGALYSALASSALVDPPYLGQAWPAVWFLGVAGFMIGPGVTQILTNKLAVGSKEYKARLVLIRMFGGILAAIIVLAYVAHFACGWQFVSRAGGLLYLVIVLVFAISVQATRQAHALIAE